MDNSNPSLRVTSVDSEAEMSCSLSVDLNCRFRGNINVFVLLNLYILGCLLCDIRYLELTVRAFQEEATIASAKVSRNKRAHTLFLKWERFTILMESLEVSIHHRPTYTMKPPVYLPEW